MVKSAKLWREIHLQYARLAELDGAAPNERPSVSPHGVTPAHGEQAGAEAELDVAAAGKSDFYRDGFQHKHWVLVLCATMILCEWMDRSILSIAMQPIKEEFFLTDTQVGIIASASLWLSPIAVTFVGRVADHFPKATILGGGVLAWGLCTIATGCSQSLRAMILSRLLAGLANCAGYPVAISLLAEHFGSGEMTTAMGYFNSGCALGGLIGFAVGGLLITRVGWRWAFWCVGFPQLVLAVLLFTTVRSTCQPSPKQAWIKDIWRLMQLPSLRFLMLGAFLTGLMSGNHRFISAIAERVYSVKAETVGLVMGGALGVSGVIAASVGAHTIDRAMRRYGSPSVLLWCAVIGDFFHLLFGTAALFAPTFELLVLGLALSACSSSMGQGVDTSIQMLAVGRRATTQAFLELNWSVGMGLGPFLGGVLSDSFYSISCDSGCALSQSLLIVGGMGLALRMFVYMMASAHLPDDVAAVNREFKAEGCAEGSTNKPSGELDLEGSASRSTGTSLHQEVKEASWQLDKAIAPGCLSSPDCNTTVYGRSDAA